MTAASISLLGQLSIETDAQGGPARGLPGRRAELVFAYLVAEHQRAVSRDELADALWPGALPDSWAAALRGVITEVRRFLADAGLDPAEVLVSAGGGYRLRLPPDVVVDLDEARRALAAALEQHAGGDPARAAAHAERAGALARLPFLPHHDSEWADGVRNELASMHSRALELQIRAHSQAGDPRAAADSAERLVRVEPFSESAHRLRIRVLGETGDRAGARAAYEHCRRVLATELGVQPSAETDAALERALGRPPASQPQTADAADLAGWSVLVVEDHDFQRRTAVQLLRGLGVGRIGEAADGTAALELIARSGPPDVIVCDLDMPGMDGVEFIRRLAEGELASAVIISSGMEPNVVHAVEALTEAYGLPLLGAIEKPLTARRLAALLEEHRRHPASRAADEPGAEVTAADLDGGRIGARFRPMVDLATGGVGGATVMLGRHEPERGWIPAATAGPGLETRITDHALRLACAAARKFARADLDVDVAAHVSSISLADTAVADRFARLADDHGVSPRRIQCTISERALRRDATGLATMARLRLKGFGVALEDFGRAHASAERIGRLPLSGVKLAASLVSGAAADDRRAAALEQALEVAHGLGLVVTAAGCDSAQDFELLLQLGCRHAEGAFIAGPMDADELVSWAGSWSPPPVGGGLT